MVAYGRLALIMGFLKGLFSMLNVGNVSNTQKRKLISSTLGARWTLLRTGSSYISKILAPTSSKLIILEGSEVYISNNGGTTWTATGLQTIANNAASGTYIVDIDCSADGNVILAAGGRTTYMSGNLVAFGYDGYFYISTNGGSSWTTVTSYGSDAWRKAAVSADGQKMYLLQEESYMDGASATPNSGIWSSTNGGSTWSRLTQTVNSRKVSSDWEITTSADGSIVYVMFTSHSGAPNYTAYFNVYKSTNSGATWSNVTPTIASPTYNGYDPWVIKCSDDGSVVFVAEREDFVVSTNGGSSWTSKSIWVNAYLPYMGIDCSSDGKIAYVTGYDYPDTVNDLFVSQNYGADWTKRRDTSIGSNPPYYTDRVACSSDGLTAYVTDAARNLYRVSYVK